MNGDLKILEAKILVFRNSQDEGIFLQLSDVSLDVKLEDTIEISNHKDRLLRFVSHEFRTPLNCSLAMLEMMKSMISTNLCKTYLEPALNSSQMLLCIVNDILDFSQIKAKKLKISVKKCNLRKIFDDVIDMMKIQASTFNIKLILNWDGELPKWFHTDANRLKQILLNLISNAFKFTQKGSVTVRVLSIEPKLINVEVIDTGVGISKEGLSLLFQEFNKVQDNAHLNPQGVGLGLVISKLLSHELGPEDTGLTVESEEGKGTTFSFMLISKPEESPSHEITYNKTVDLDVSDDEDRERPDELLKRMKQRFGMIDQATKPTQHEEISRMSLEDVSPKSQNITNILKKLQVKKSLIRQETLKKTATLGNATKSSVLLSHNKLSVEPFRPSALSQGEAALILKPESKNKKRKSRPRSVMRSGTSLSTEDANSHMYKVPSWELTTLVYNLNLRCSLPKVLVVDDNAFNLTALNLVLKTMSLESTLVANGELAIKQVLEFQNHDEQCKNYSIIFMDIEMPRLNGFETTQILRRKMIMGEISFIPIIGVTGHNPKEKKVECLLSGMNDMIIKPVTPMMLQTSILKWVDDIQ